MLPASLQMHIKKEKSDDGFWARLLKARDANRDTRCPSGPRATRGLSSRLRHRLRRPLPQDKQLEKTNVQVDWNKYVDEDEEDEGGGFDMSALDGGAVSTRTRARACAAARRRGGVAARRRPSSRRHSILAPLCGTRGGHVLIVGLVCRARAWEARGVCGSLIDLSSARACWRPE